MIASERRRQIVVEGETRHSLTKKLALSGRPVKIYVIDPKQFKARFDKLNKEKELQDDKKAAATTQHAVQNVVPPPTVVAPLQQPALKYSPIPIAPKEPNNNNTTTIPGPTTILLPLPTMIPVSLSLPIMTSSMHLAAVPTSSIIPHIQQAAVKRTLPPKKKQTKKKKRVNVDMSNARSLKRDEEGEKKERAFLLKDSTTTKAGRVVRSVVAGAAEADSQFPPPHHGTGTAPSPTVTPPSVPRPKKRISEKFRCQTCQKFYVGNARFNQHFQKFPDHVKPDPNCTTTKKASPPPPEHDPPPPETSSVLGAFNSVRTSSSSINPDTLSDNCTSPKLPAFTMPMQDSSNCPSPKLPAFTMQDSSNSTPFPSTSTSTTTATITNERQSPEHGSSFFMDFQSDFNAVATLSGPISSDLIGNGSCSQQSFNSLENLLADDCSRQQNGGLNESTHTDLSPTRSDTPVFFSSTVTSSSSISNSTSANLSSYTTVNCCTTPVPSIPVVTLDEEESQEEKQVAVREQSEKVGSPPPTLNSRRNKSIWDFVKEQIRICGINQTCGEISEMAEKLSKIARDKFYPIQEEEVERAANSPVIHVDTPFISHLLDLPLGNYVFKEDGGTRKIIPPPTPVSTDLSLTNGVEVDVDKFLSPDMDLVCLPHLTNLDFHSICN